MAEDPRTRRTFGGGALRWVFSLLPMTQPEIVATPSGPAVFHGDFSLVSPANPARAGELLILMAAGLGPTRPAIQPGQKFRDEPVQVVNSPVQVMVNGASVEVVNKIGWPGTSDTFRVDIRLPEATGPGMAAVQLSAAWIPGAEVRIPVR